MPPLPHALEPGLGAPRQGEVSAVAAGGGKQRVEGLRMGGTSAFEVEVTVWWENAMPSNGSTIDRIYQYLTSEAVHVTWQRGLLEATWTGRVVV